MSSNEHNELSGFSQRLAALVEEIAPTVVAIRTGAYRVSSGIKLGNQLIAAASHAIRSAEQVLVQTADGAELTASVLGREPGLDLAILKTQGLGDGVLNEADPMRLKVGALAVVVGMTIDVGATASLGILGAIGPTRKLWRGGTLDHFVRLDVNSYPSQSGAAAVNADGELIGMTTPALSRHSCLAIPLSTIRRTARELLEQGRIRRGYLGIGVQPVTLPESLRANLPGCGNRGLILLSVEPESPAERAGLQLGDILVLFNGTPMNHVDDLHEALRGAIVGNSVPALFVRSGKPVEVALQVHERGPRL